MALITELMLVSKSAAGLVGSGSGKISWLELASRTGSAVSGVLGIISFLVEVVSSISIGASVESASSTFCVSANGAVVVSSGAIEMGAAAVDDGSG